jgi:molybdopterin synthase sulfur carrier subunit
MVEAVWDENQVTAMATVYIPPLMQKLTKGQQTVTVVGCNVRQVINNLEGEYPGMKERLVDKYRMKSNITVAVDGVVSPIGLLEKVGEESEVHFLTPIGGGRESAERAPTGAQSLTRPNRVDVAGKAVSAPRDVQDTMRSARCPPMTSKESLSPY